MVGQKSDFAIDLLSDLIVEPLFDREEDHFDAEEHTFADVEKELHVWIMGIIFLYPIFDLEQAFLVHSSHKSTTTFLC